MIASLSQSGFTRRLEKGFFPEIESVNEQARCALRASSYHAIRVVHCDFQNGVLRLNGSVSSFYLKQLVQALVKHIPGVERVDNRVSVILTPDA